MYVTEKKWAKWIGIYKKTVLTRKQKKKELKGSKEKQSWYVDK